MVLSEPTVTPIMVKLTYGDRIKSAEDTWKAKKAVFEGCVLPAIHREQFETDVDYETNVSLASRCAMRFKGLPISMEHQYPHGLGEQHDPERHVVVGRVEDSWMKDDTSVWIRGNIDPKIMKGSTAIEAIKKGMFKGLSLAHRNLRSRATGELRQVPIEVSLCKEGMRPDTWIDTCVLASKNAKTNYNTQELLDTLYDFASGRYESDTSTTMASSSAAGKAEETVPPKPAATPAAAEDKDEKMEDAAPAAAAPAETEEKRENLTKMTNSELLAKLVKQEEEKLKLAKELAAKNQAEAEKDKRLQELEAIEKTRKEEEMKKFIEENEALIDGYVAQALQNSDVKVTKKNIGQLRNEARLEAISMLQNGKQAWMVKSVQAASKAAALEEENRKLRECNEKANQFYDLSARYQQTRNTVLASQSSKMNLNEDADPEKMEEEEEMDEDTSDAESAAVSETSTTKASRSSDTAMSADEIMRHMARMRSAQSGPRSGQKRGRAEKTKARDEKSSDLHSSLQARLESVIKNHTPLKDVFPHEMQPEEIMMAIRLLQDNGSVVRASSRCSATAPMPFSNNSLLRNSHLLMRDDLDLPFIPAFKKQELSSNPDMRNAWLRSSTVRAKKAWTSDGQEWTGFAPEKIQPSHKNGLGQNLTVNCWNPELGAMLLTTMYNEGASTYMDASNAAEFTQEWTGRNERQIEAHLNRMNQLEYESRQRTYGHAY